MFEMWGRDAELIGFMLFCAVLVIFPFQLILCSKAKKRLIRLLPTMFLSAMAVLFAVMMRLSKSWAAFLYAILFVFSVVFLLFCGTAWAIWALIRFFKIKNKTQQIK